MRELVISSSTAEELSVEERNLLSVAYKNVIGSRRAAWRTLNAGVDEGKYDDLLLAYRKQVESELSDVCLDVLNLLEDTLVKNNTKENEARVFYLKMTGDYYRYLAEFVTDRQYEQKAADYYKQAQEISTKVTHKTHATRTQSRACLFRKNKNSASDRSLSKRSLCVFSDLPRSSSPPTPSAWAWR